MTNIFQGHNNTYIPERVGVLPCYYVLTWSFRPGNKKVQVKLSDLGGADPFDLTLQCIEEAISCCENHHSFTHILTLSLPFCHKCLYTVHIQVFSVTDKTITLLMCLH